MKKCVFIILLIAFYMHTQPAFAVKAEYYTDVIKAFEINPERAKQIYTDRKHLIVGTITRISENWFYIFLRFRDNFQIRLPIKDKAKVDKLSAGDFILVYGTVTRKFPGNWLQMSDAKLLRTYNPNSKKWE